MPLTSGVPWSTPAAANTASPGRCPRPRRGLIKGTSAAGCPLHLRSHCIPAVSYPEEKSDAVRAARPAVRPRRARPLHVEGDAGIPPRQAPPGLCQQRQQPAQGHRVGEQVAGRDREGLVRQERRPLQQRRPALQPPAFLEVDEAAAAAATRFRARSRPRSTAISAASPRPRKTSSRPASPSSAPAGAGSR